MIGIWDRGARLTDATGTTLLAGHVHYPGQGDGTFYALTHSRPGNVVYVADISGHVTTWRVTSLVAVPKALLTTAVFAGTRGPRRLVMATCGGPIHYLPGYGTTYAGNILVIAVRA